MPFVFEVGKGGEGLFLIRKSSPLTIVDGFHLAILALIYLTCKYLTINLLILSDFLKYVGRNPKLLPLEEQLLMLTLFNGIERQTWHGGYFTCIVFAPVDIVRAEWTALPFSDGKGKRKWSRTGLRSQWSNGS